MQVDLGHTACSMDCPSDAVITAQPQILARATPWRTCGVARQCAPQAVRWTFVYEFIFGTSLELPGDLDGLYPTIADPQPLHRVPGLYPRYIRNDQKDRLSAMILGSTVLGWACAMRCFPISTGSSNWLSRSPIWMAMKGSLSLDEPSRLYTGQILIFQVPDHWNWHIQISFQVQCLVSCWSKLRTSTHGCFEGV
jgi:hypothetical protein